MLWRRALCNNQVFSFSYEGLSNEMDVPSREVERAENCKVKRSMGVLDLHPDSSALSVSPSLPFLAILANIFSDIHLCSLPAVNFLVAAIMTVCLGIGGEGGMEGCTAGESITGEYGFVFSSLFCLKFLQDEYISQFCRSNICFHSFRWDVHLYFFLVRCWMLSVCSGAPHSLNSRDQYL